MASAGVPWWRAVRLLAAAALAATSQLGLPAAALAAGDAPEAPAGLTVDDRAAPLDVELPRFGWLPRLAGGNAVQTAYQIRVVRALDGGLVADTGKVRSSEQSYVPYQGPPLRHGTAYQWRVRTWDRRDRRSPWSAPGGFDTGIADAEWAATWIRRLTASADSTVDYTLARRQFALADRSPVLRARAYTSAMGSYELNLNGRALYRGDSFGYPGEGQYAVTDITAQAREAQRASGAARGQLAVGMLEHYHTCTCQGRANGPPTNATTLAADAAAGAGGILVASVNGLVPGDVITVGVGGDGETRAITAVGSAGASGSGLTLDAPLRRPHPAGSGAVSSNGPSGMLVRVVVDHADGLQEAFVSDGSWRVRKAEQWTNAVNTRRNSDAGDFVERYDARNETPGWDAAGFDDSAWSQATVIGPHPRPASALQDRFTHLDPAVSGIAYQTVHPASVARLADGTVVADFGRVMSAVPRMRLGNGVAGRELTVQTSYRLANSTLAAPAGAGDTAVRLESVANLAAGDRLTVDAAGLGNPHPRPEARTITAVGTAGAGGTGVTLDSPLTAPHAVGRYVEGTRAGTSTTDTQGSDMSWHYTERDGAQTAQAFTYWGWRYLQINAPGPGEDLGAADLAAVVQHTDAPPGRAASFSSDNPTLDAAFELMRRSGLETSQETMVDTPTREKGQFLGDATDISFATMTASGERNATRRAIREFVYSGTHVWKSPNSAYCTAAPCSYPGYGQAGRLNAVYPNGDNMRDIPDYTEFFPQLVWQYYLLSGDRATLRAAYGTLRNVAEYVHAAQPASGPAAGLPWILPGGSGPYQGGIIDWPSRFGYVFTDNGARTIHAHEAVAVYRDVALAAKVLGERGDASRYGGYADELARTVNARQRIDGDTLYADGLGLSSTTLAAPAAIGDTTIRVAGVAPFSVGEPVALDYLNGARKEVRTVTAVGGPGADGSGVTLDAPLEKPHAGGAIASASTATRLLPAATTLASAAGAGELTIKVAATAGFDAAGAGESSPGPTLIVGTGADREVLGIAAVGTPGADGTGITLRRPLSRDHPAGALVASPSQQAQAFAVYDGTAPPSDWSDLAGFIAAQGQRSAPMDWGVTLSALGMGGQPDAIVDFVTSPDQFGPGQILASNGTFMWEDWLPSGNTSFSHGWGARGVVAVLEYLLGIRVTAPGAAVVEIAPPGGGLGRASGSEWTQRGTVRVDWARNADGTVRLDVRVPDNVTARVSLPAAAGQRYLASGEGAPRYERTSGGRALFTVGSGSTRFRPAGHTR